MACSQGCPNPGSHESWGECVRAKNTRVAWANSATGKDLTTVKKFQREIDDYRAVRRQGIVPDGSKQSQIDKAVRISNETGEAYVSKQ